MFRYECSVFEEQVDTGHWTTNLCPYWQAHINTVSPFIVIAISSMFESDTQEQFNNIFVSEYLESAELIFQKKKILEAIFPLN